MKAKLFSVAVSKGQFSRATGLGLLVLASSCSSPADPVETSQDRENPAASDATPASETLAPLVKILYSEQHSFNIYDYGSSAAYSETGTYLDSPVQVLSDDDYRDPVRVFSKLAPEEPIPASLLEFSARLSAAKATTYEPDGGAPREAASEQAGIQLTTNLPAAAESKQLSALPRAATNNGQTVIVVPSKKLQSTKNLLVADENRNGGSAGGNCPFSLFQGVSGPLGPFCPSTGSANQVWCYQDLNGISGDGSNAATSTALVTLCANVGQAQLNVRYYQPLGTLKVAHSYNQPAGTWTQWRVTKQCWCDSVPWYCFGLCTPACFCDLFGIGFDVPSIPGGGSAQIGGYWNPY